MIREIPYREDSSEIFQHLLDHPWPVFLDSGFPRSQQGRFDILTANPYKTLVTRGGVTEIASAQGPCRSLDDPFDLIKENLPSRQQRFSSLPFSGGAIGYFAYDLARRIEQLPETARDDEQLPEMMVGIFDWAVVVDHQVRCSWLVQHDVAADTRAVCERIFTRITGKREGPAPAPGFRVKGKVVSNMTRNEYGQAFRRIKHYLREGDCYQVNLAQRFAVACEGDPWGAYQRLRELNPAPYSGYLNFSDVQILSSSPERFLEVREGRVETKPIKGTLPRSDDAVKDREQVDLLSNSLKDRAENLMIVDLLRNDLSKNCERGSVTVPLLFDVESFATVHHLVSTVCGQLASDAHSVDLLKGCFPGGSITGAPKIRAMEIIEELEPNRRGIYCGSIGYIGYDGNMDTNITIRTLVHSEQSIRCWAGGGIVSDSVESAEYQESLDKAAAMLNLLAGFQSDQHSNINRRV